MFHQFSQIHVSLHRAVPRSLKISRKKVVEMPVQDCYVQKWILVADDTNRSKILQIRLLDFCCRLLGPSTAADILQLTNTLTSQASVPLRTHIYANDDLRIISRPDEDFFEEVFQVVSSFSSSVWCLPFPPRIIFFHNKPCIYYLACPLDSTTLFWLVYSICLSCE